MLKVGHIAQMAPLRLYARILGIVFLVLAGAMLPPLLVSLVSLDGTWRAMFASFLLFVLLGYLLRNVLGSQADYDVQGRNSFWITAMVWIVVPLVASIPYLLTGVARGFTDAAFESFSGFTTTGSSVISTPEQLPAGLLLWRSITQWIGGLGFMLIVVVAFRKLKVGSRHLYDAEFSGAMQPKLHPRLAESVNRMLRVYVLMTALMTVLLLLSGNGLLNSFCLSFSTISTGGFMTSSNGLTSMSGMTLFVVAFFMLFSGMNMALLYNFVTFRWRAVRGDEFRVYLVVFVTSVVVASVALIAAGNGATSLCYAFFHLASTISTCGFFIQRPEHWSFLVSGITFVLMIVGACSGSTGSGLKLKRVMIGVRYVRNYFSKIMHPNAVFSVMVEGERIPPAYIKKVFAFIFLYLCFLAGGAFLLTLGGENIPDAVCFAVSNMGNIGPSPMMNNLGMTIDYAMLSDFSKWTLMVLMLAGRIEIFALLALVSPSYYRLKRELNFR